MKRSMLAIGMAFCLAMTPVAAYAEETESAAETEAVSSIVVMQGIDSQNIIWTLALDVASGRAAVNLLAPAEDGSYSEDNGTTISGNASATDDTLTITDEEDGNDYVFGMESVEGSEDDVKMSYEETGSEVILSPVDQAITSQDENMAYYAGLDESGNQWTVGFDFDNSAIALDIRTPDGGENTVAGTFEDDGEGTLTITDENGETADWTYEALDEDWTAITLTDQDGASITVSYVNPDILNSAAE